jgi:hypothetical protein
MDILLNGIFFKCCFCKVLTKIVNRESISPEHENRFLNSHPLLMENDIKGLFQPNSGFENNTPFRNLFNSGGTNSNNNLLNFNNFIPGSERATSNLIGDFNKIKPSNNFFQTPKNIRITDESLFFSPDSSKGFQTPQNRNVFNSGNFSLILDNFISLRNMGLMTPKVPKNVSEFSANKSNVDEVSTDDFQKKLMINPQADFMRDNANINNASYNSDFSTRYTLLAGRNRVGRLINTNW